MTAVNKIDSLVLHNSELSTLIFLIGLKINSGPVRFAISAPALMVREARIFHIPPADFPGQVKGDRPIQSLLCNHRKP